VCFILDKGVDEFALLQENLGGGVARSVKLAPLTSFGIGGPARYFFRAENPGRLAAAFYLAITNNLRFFILGGGSNILFSDEGYNGLVIKDDCHEYVVRSDVISAQSGVLLDDLVGAATNDSLSGFEFAAGIPGTVGGAIYGNAGAFGKSIADVLESAVVYGRDGGVKIVVNEYFKFGYRYSRLKDKPELIISASFKLEAGEKTRIADKVKGHLELRKAKHPSVEGSAGSVFKNIKEPKPLSAGRLLEETGLKGLKVGGAEIFTKHCNIIVNTGSATAADVKKLAKIMHDRVLEKHGIDLEYELLVIEP
jgi:UDP-N-acetylmuramate dehydrogenase